MTDPSSHHQLFVVAFLSNPHVPTRIAPRIRDLAIKSLRGWLSREVKRRLMYKDIIVRSLLAAPLRNHVVVTGNIVTVARHHEFAAAAWFSQVGTPDPVSVVQGTPDTGVAGRFSEPLKLLAAASGRLPSWLPRPSLRVR
jgi:hypothetical protein